MKAPSSRAEPSACPLCGSRLRRPMGVRGTREYSGADPAAEPHIATQVVRCLECDFFYTDPVIRGFEHLEREYYGDPSIYSASHGRQAGEMFRDRLAYLARFVSPGSLLDVGAGKGDFLAEARQRGWQVQGIEPSSKFCDYAESCYGLRLHRGRLEQMAALSENAFDLVTFHHVLEHVERPGSLIESAMRLLRPGGALFIEVPNCDSFLLRAVDFYFRLKGLDWSSRLSPLHPPFHRQGFTRRSLSYLLARCGCEVLDMSTFSGRDRGYRRVSGPRRFEHWLRSAASTTLDCLGNRELLAVIARPSA